MGLLTTLLSRGPERRGHPRNLGDPVLNALMGFGLETNAGVDVTAETAMTYSAVYACVKVGAETMAMLPMQVLEHIDGGGRQQARAHPLWRVLHDAPNEWQTAMEFSEMMVGHLMLRGNFYAEIVTDGAARVVALVPLHPGRMRVERRPSGMLAYHYRTEAGQAVTYLQGEVLHVRGMSMNGVVGLSPIAHMREAIGLGMAAEQYGSRFFRNNGRPAGILTSDLEISPEGRKNVREEWTREYGGSENVGKVAVLEQGLKWQSVGMENDDAQFLEIRKFQIAEIARAYRIPLHMVGDLERSTNNNIEQQALEFRMYFVSPLARRIEQACERDLFTDSMRGARGQYYIKLNDKALLRGDVKSRFEAHKLGRDMGVLSANDIREIEDMNPLPAEIGDVYLVPLNMVDAETLGQEPAPPAAGESPAPPNAGRAQALAIRSNIVRAHARLFADALSRAARAASADREKGKFDAEKFRGFVERVAGPAASTLADAVAGTVAFERGIPIPDGVDAAAAGYVANMARLLADMPDMEARANLATTEAVALANVIARRVYSAAGATPEADEATGLLIA